MTRDEIIHEFGKLFYESWRENTREWLGVHIIKYPTDLFIYQMILWQNRPDFFIETGSCKGGGSLFFASMFDLIGHGEVISIDYRDLNPRKHPRITYLHGKSWDPAILAQVKAKVGKGSCMVLLDSDHKQWAVKKELVAYSPFVTKGQYLIVEDTYLNGHPVKPEWGPGPYEAVEWFLRHNNRFVIDPLHERYLVSMNPNGFLKRVS